MWETPLFAIIGSLVGIVAAGIASFMGFFVKQTLSDFRKAQTEFREAQAKIAGDYYQTTQKTERRLDSRLAEMANNLNVIERQGIILKAEVQKDFRQLHEDFVPRREIAEVVNGVRAMSEANMKGIEKMDNKLEQIINILINREKV